MSDANDSLLEFPCDFSVKAFGRGDTDFEAAVYRLVKTHVPELTPGDLSTRKSSGGNYLAVTATFHAQSKAQLDAIYQDLTDSGQVLMSL